MKAAPQKVTRVEPPRNCWTCGHTLRITLPDGGTGYTCTALTLDEETDQPIIDYVSAHCDVEGDGMPVDAAACPAWVPR